MLVSPLIFFFVLFVVGTAFGSFLNVLTLRYRPERSVFARPSLEGRSHCLHCGKTLAWYELVPLVSFIIQGGRCRSCHVRLSVQYPLVELASGAAWVTVPLFLNAFYGISNTLFASLAAPHWYYGLVLLWLCAFLTWIAIFVIDLRHYLIPNELNIFLGIVGLLVILVVSANQGALPAFRDSFLRHYALLTSSAPLAAWLSHLIGAVVGGVTFGFLAFIGRGRAMGMGDVKLALASGLLLGWPDILLTTLIAFVCGGVWGIVLVLTREKKFGDRLPFAPFFVFGAVVSIFFGYRLLSAYFALLGF